MDGSAKADAEQTGQDADVVWGVVFELEADQEEQTSMRRKVLHHGYEEKAGQPEGLRWREILPSLGLLCITFTQSCHSKTVLLVFTLRR